MASEDTNLQTTPSQYGRRPPPVLLDEIAARDPKRVLYSVAKTDMMHDGFHDISHKVMANAVNRRAHWLQQTLGTDKSRIFCYLGPLDLRYVILIMAAPKAGHTVGHPSAPPWGYQLTATSKAFLTSHRNSLEAHMSLVQRTGCSALLLPKEPLPVTRHILDGWPMEIFTTPDLDFLQNRTTRRGRPLSEVVQIGQGRTLLHSPYIWVNWYPQAGGCHLWLVRRHGCPAADSLPRPQVYAPELCPGKARLLRPARVSRRQSQLYRGYRFIRPRGRRSASARAAYGRPGQLDLPEFPVIWGRHGALTRR